jgi:F-type H+-transporting ATPase subunit b
MNRILTVSFPPIYYSAPAVANFHASLPHKQEEKSTTPAEPPKGLWNPMLSVPLGIAFAVPALSYEWYLVNEETQLAACFIAFTMLIYQQFGGSIHEFLAADGKRMLKDHNAKENDIIQMLQEQLDDMKMQSNIVKDAQDIQAVREATYEKLNAAGQIKPQYDFKAQMEKVLGMLATEEASMTEKAKHALMKDATEAVKAKFASSKDLQKSSLDLAIAQLEGKGGQGDLVQAAFIDFFKAKAKEAATADEAAELAETRKTIVRKLNAVAMNENFVFRLDENGQPKMVV